MYPQSDTDYNNQPTEKGNTKHPGIGATVEVCTFLDIADSFKLFQLVSEHVVYPLLMLVKGLLESRNGSVVPLVQLGKSFIVDTYFEVALLCLDNGMAYSVNYVVCAPVGCHKCHFR